MKRRDVPNGSMFRYRIRTHFSPPPPAFPVYHAVHPAPQLVYRAARIADEGHPSEGATVDIPWPPNPWASRQDPPFHLPCNPRLDEEVEIVETAE